MYGQPLVRMSFTLLERGKSEKLRLNKEEFASTASLLVSSSIDPIIHSVGSTSRLCSNEIVTSGAIMILVV